MMVSRVVLTTRPTLIIPKVVYMMQNIVDAMFIGKMSPNPIATHLQYNELCVGIQFIRLTFNGNDGEVKSILESEVHNKGKY